MLKIKQLLMYVYLCVSVTPLSVSVTPLSVSIPDISLILLLKADFQL